MSATLSYEEFVASKQRRFAQSGFVPKGIESYDLFDFQSATVRWALGKGKACVFAGTGLGKTRMQLAIADQVAKHTDKPFLIICPLAVAGQTIDEGSRLGIEVKRASGNEITEGVWIINYERLDQLDVSVFGGVALDESSILKSHDGSYRKMLTDSFVSTPYKFALTATPAPNDYMELGTHAEFIGACSRLEMLAEYFTHDGGDTSKWRLKRHARADFWQWVASWAISFNDPSDLGFDGSRYQLPPLNLVESIVGDPNIGFGGMFGELADVSATGVHKTQKLSASERIDEALRIAASSDDPIILWCSTNDEQTALAKLLPDAVSVIGSDSPEKKESALLGFSRGEFKTLITKPSIAGFGMNWQHCSRMVFVSISYSFEMLYQAIRRCYRFGQTKPVTVHLIYSEAEDAIRQALRFKQEAHVSMLDEMRKYAKQEVSA